MSAVHEIEKLLSQMSRAEKAEMLRLVARDLGDVLPGVESTPGVCGGKPRIVRTRIPVWALEQARRLGASEAELLRIYPALRAKELVDAWAYCPSNKDAPNRQIQSHEPPHRTPR